MLSIIASIVLGLESRKDLLSAHQASCAKAKEPILWYQSRQSIRYMYLVGNNVVH